MDDVTAEHVVDPRVLDPVLEVLARRAGEIDLQSSFIANGGDSLKAVLLTSALAAQGCRITRESLLTGPRLGDVLGHLQLPASPGLAASKPSSEPSSGTQSSNTSPGSTPSSTTTSLSSSEGENHEFRRLPAGILALPAPRDSEVVDLATEMQLSLTHETYTHCGSNVIIYVEHHPSERVPALFSAWRQAMELEAIFQGSWFRDLTSTRTRDQSEWPGFSLDMAPCDAGPGGKLVSKIIWKVHHAFIDACSFQSMLLKVRKLASGGKAEPGPSFWDWARQFRQYQVANKSEGDAFWRETLDRHGDDAKGAFLLPTPALAAAPDTVTFELGTGTAEAAAKMANVTPAAVFYAAWALVVSTFADSDSVVFGAVLSGRSLGIPGSLDVVGPLINVLPLHVRLGRAAGIGTFLAGLFRDLVGLETYSWTTTDNGFARQYDSAVSVDMPEPTELQHHPLQPLATHTTQRSQVPISVTVRRLRTVELQFHPERFGRRDMLAIAECYEQALATLTKPAHTTVGSALQSLLSCPSHGLLMGWGNCISGLTTRSSVTQDLVVLFEATAEAHPDAVAVERGDVRLSYRELDDISGKVAARLSAMTSPGDVVGVHSDRSIHWICAIWGVLKAGCVYCSLDPSLPRQLREAMVLTAASSVFVAGTDEQVRTCTPAASQRFLSVESAVVASAGAPGPLQDEGRPEGESEGDPPKAGPPFPRRASAQPWATAYVCFTSGSTGTPKPVLCSHGGLVAFQSDLQVRLNARPGVRVAQIMSAAFDGSIHEIFSALTHGATLVLSAGADALAPLGAADSAILTPSVARALDPSDYPDLQWASTGQSAFPFLPTPPPSSPCSPVVPGLCPRLMLCVTGLPCWRARSTGCCRCVVRPRDATAVQHVRPDRGDVRRHHQEASARPPGNHRCPQPDDAPVHLGRARPPPPARHGWAHPSRGRAGVAGLSRHASPDRGAVPARQHRRQRREDVRHGRPGVLDRGWRGGLPRAQRSPGEAAGVPARSQRSGDPNGPRRGTGRSCGHRPAPRRRRRDRRHGAAG